MTKPRLTIADVARAAGVSVGAVSVALNDRPGVSEVTRARILGVVRELGWTPSHRGRALSSSRAWAVGLVVARTPQTLAADPFFPAFLAGLETVLSERRQALLLQVVSDQQSEQESYERLAGDGRVDGVLLTDLHIDDPRPALLAQLGLPAVLVGPDRSRNDTNGVSAADADADDTADADDRADADDAANAEGTSGVSVAVDDRPGIAAAVAHLVALGHRNIAHVAGPSTLVHGASRRAAWEAALGAAGLPLGRCIHSDFSASGGAAATNQLLGLDDPPTAIVYANDLMAVAGLSTAIGLGVRVPDDLSVTGFDDSPVAAHLQPALTTVRSDVVGWGAAAARALLALVDGDPQPPVDLAPARLVVRASTAAPGHTAALAPHSPTATPASPAPTTEENQ